jgi:hypothetical protein
MQGALCFLMLDTYMKALIAMGRDARTLGKPRDVIASIEAEIALRCNVIAMPQRYDVRVVYSDHCLSDYLPMHSGEGRIVLGVDPRRNGSTLDALIERIINE